MPASLSQLRTMDFFQASMQWENKHSSIIYSKEEKRCSLTQNTLPCNKYLCWSLQCSKVYLFFHSFASWNACQSMHGCNDDTLAWIVPQPSFILQPHTSKIGQDFIECMPMVSYFIVSRFDNTSHEQNRSGFHAMHSNGFPFEFVVYTCYMLPW